MVDLSVVALGIHAIQLIFAIIVLGLTGHGMVDSFPLTAVY